MADDILAREAAARQRIIKDVYLDPRTGFGSIANTLKAAKERNPFVKRSEVKEFMETLRERQDRPQRGYNSFVQNVGRRGQWHLLLPGNPCESSPRTPLSPDYRLEGWPEPGSKRVTRTRLKRTLLSRHRQPDEDREDRFQDCSRLPPPAADRSV
mmetsp:Transcript_14390/g.34153  ORF Transcript_14390/g.34153 Transcript_14390/m.34153 type:complete len:155 (-) Transcript_14390:198-662(-)